MSTEPAHELGNMASAKATTSPPIVDEVSSSGYADDQHLARLGKKPVLKRNFGFMSILGFSCTILITWEATLVLSTPGLANGGPAGVIYGYIIVWLGNISVFTTLSELVSMAPTSGGQYHWAAMLAPRSCAKFLSYLTGWLTVGGWQGSVASSGFLTGNMLQGMITMTATYYDYTPQPWHGTLLYWAVILFAVFINAVVSSALPKFEGLILVLHVLGFFAILIPLVILSPHGDADAIFTGFLNSGNWPTQGLSFMVGMIGNVFAFVGTDAAFHMAEETHNPSVVVPKSILISMLINGTTGFAMTVAVLFCLGDDIDSLLNSVTGFPHMQIFLNSTGSISGATTMAAIITALGICATVGMLASTSRVFWSFARDRGLPFWRTLSKVDSRTTVPLYAIAVTTIISCLLALIQLGSVTAFNSIVSISVSGLYSSYLIVAVLLLYRRCTSGFKMPDPSELPALANTSGSELVWGPWHLPGALGIANNAFACLYLIIIWFFSFWPPALPVSPDNMNYAPLMTGAMVLFSIVYYFVWANKEYEGPIIEIDI
ncbi:hypothetical protein H634G_01885 [Metarhizium anisopliae BRIP 53293]|uniref:Choline transport protein n=1 Tax=Metarhizium anisopliae BRIP 53293 TaxID=1291518 RepID=A0A0D9P9C5_METAN|nr:hypothetical protein H634G_01885 [Metarhizium anisopliae BRIP 53293]KJK94231.1 hypothetical protein H633G_01926 [Metarhizium anisopliae BRIP 53284]